MSASVTGRQITVEAKPAPISIDSRDTAVLVVDMQNDFGTEGGMFHRAGIDISPIKAVVKPITGVLAAARAHGMRAVYLKMGFESDLSDSGPVGSPNRDRHAFLSVGQTARGHAHRLVSALEKRQEAAIHLRCRFSLRRQQSFLGAAAHYGAASGTQKRVAWLPVHESDYTIPLGGSRGPPAGGG
jgi:hypothetical protein